MAVNPAVGAQYGFTPEQWAGMTQAQRDRYKSGATSSSQIAAQLQAAGLGFQDVVGSGTAPAAAPAGDYYSYPTGGAGGAGGVTISRPTYDVNADPSYQAFVAALDQMGEMYRSQATAKQAEYDRQLQDALPRIAEQGVEQRRNISGAAESRGIRCWALPASLAVTRGLLVSFFSSAY